MTTKKTLYDMYKNFSTAELRKLLYTTRRNFTETQSEHHAVKCEVLYKVIEERKKHGV